MSLFFWVTLHFIHWIALWFGQNSSFHLMMVLQYRNYLTCVLWYVGRGLRYFAQCSSSSNQSNQQDTTKSPQNHKKLWLSTIQSLIYFFFSENTTFNAQLKWLLSTLAAEYTWPFLAFWLSDFLIPGRNKQRNFPLRDLSKGKTTHKPCWPVQP